MSVAILTYHSLDDSTSVISVAPRVFAAQMHSLAQSGIRVKTRKVFDINGERNMSHEHRPDLSVVAPSVNGWTDLEGALDALDAQQGGVTLKVLVVERVGEAVRCGAQCMLAAHAARAGGGRRGR